MISYTMITHNQFYGSEKYFARVIHLVRDWIENTEKQTTVTENAKNEITIKSHDQKIRVVFQFLEPQRFLEYYQTGLKRMEAIVDSTGEESIHSYVETLSKIFSPEEEEKLYEYTPLLSKMVSNEYLENQVLSDTIVIFREHSLISVFNVFKELFKLGLKPENTVYYSKGDRCKNIYRIEESFKAMGIGVFVLSPFESVSPTGKTEDETILPEAAERVRNELKPYFEKAREEKKKVIVFDDGGLMITTVIDLFGAEYGDITNGFIETTKGGMHAINARQDLDITVVNLADSEIKNLMSPVIGHSITNRIYELIPQIGLQSQISVVVGYGALGKVIAKDLRNHGMAVYVCDLEPYRVFEALSDGFPVSRDLVYLLKEFKPVLVVGCTGLDALTYENLSKIERDTYIATVSSNEIKQSYPKFDETSQLTFIDNFARIYRLPSGKVLSILGNGASLNLYNGEGATHSDYQPFLAAMIETICYCAVNGPIHTKRGLDTEIANKILKKANTLKRYLVTSGVLLDA